jgi:excisionase family DNA binding protein
MRDTMNHRDVQRAVENLVRAVGAAVDDDHPAFLAVVIPLPGRPTNRNIGRVAEPVAVRSAPTSTDAAGVPDLLTVTDVASTLRCSPSKVKKIVADGSLPSVTVGRLRRVRRSDLDAYISSLA